MVPYLFSQPNDTKRESKRRHLQEMLFFWGFLLFFMLRMKKENMYNGSYFYKSFSVFKLGKRERNLDYHIIIFHYGIGERKTEGRYIQHRVVFRLSCFHLAKHKTKMGVTDHISIFRFFVLGLEKRKRMLSYSFSIFYYEIGKRRTKGRYIHEPNIYNTLKSLGTHLSHMQFNLKSFNLSGISISDHKNLSREVLFDIQQSKCHSVLDCASGI